MSPLPGVNMSFTNGNLGVKTQLDDGVFLAMLPIDETELSVVYAGGLVASSKNLSNSGSYTVVKFNNIKDVIDLGFVAGTVNNRNAYKFLSEFYEEVVEAELYVAFWKYDTNTPAGYGYLGTDATNWFNGECLIEHAYKLSGGKISGVGVVLGDTNIGVSTDLNLDVIESAEELSAVLKYLAEERSIALFGLVEGFQSMTNTKVEATFNGALALPLPRVSLLIGQLDLFIGDPALANPDYSQALGLLMARYSQIQVHENPGKVKLGSITGDDIYLLNAGHTNSIAEQLHDLGVITFREHLGKSGFYISDDPTLDDPESDYHSMAKQRVINKAYKIAFEEISDFLLDDFDVNSNGTISPIYAKNIEGRVESAIYILMTLNGELSRDQNDPNDKGVICKIDLTYDVQGNSKIKLKGLQVRAKGTARFIDVPLGFVPITNA